MGKIHGLEKFLALEINHVWLSDSLTAWANLCVCVCINRGVARFMHTWAWQYRSLLMSDGIDDELAFMTRIWNPHPTVSFIDFDLVMHADAAQEPIYHICVMHAWYTWPYMNRCGWPCTFVESGAEFDFDSCSLKTKMTLSIISETGRFSVVMAKLCSVDEVSENVERFFSKTDFRCNVIIAVDDDLSHNSTGKKSKTTTDSSGRHQLLFLSNFPIQKLLIIDCCCRIYFHEYWICARCGICVHVSSKQDMSLCKINFFSSILCCFEYMLSHPFSL